MVDQIQEQSPGVQGPHVPEPLGLGGFFGSVLYGIGVTLGLALLWVMEVFRNMFFRMLDILNIKPRRRHASAFPPGQPRKRTNSSGTS
jgi:hypothetical protein